MICYTVVFVSFYLVSGITYPVLRHNNFDSFHHHDTATVFAVLSILEHPYPAYISICNEPVLHCIQVCISV